MATDHASQSLVFVRTDPPVDAAYMAGLWLLDAAAQQGVRVVNSPSSLTWANEKTLILRFPELIPETMVSGDPDHLRAFVTRHQRAVIKPLDGNGGGRCWCSTPRIATSTRSSR